MKLRNFIVSSFAALAAMVACQPEGEEVGGLNIDVDKTELSFPVAGDDQTVYNRQVNRNKFQNIDRPEHNTEKCDDNRQFLHFLTSGYTALSEQRKHEVKGKQNIPSHQNKVRDTISVIFVVIGKAVIKTEHQLMQVVGEHKTDQQKGRD